jgi:hypothetical protein
MKDLMDQYNIMLSQNLLRRLFIIYLCTVLLLVVNFVMIAKWFDGPGEEFGARVC